MSPQSSSAYVAALKQSGAGDDAILAILRNAGWPEKEAAGALAAHYEALTGLAPPARPRSAGGPREAFLHLLSFLTLSVWCVAAGALWFSLIDSWFPDPAAPAYGDPLAAMAWNLAWVLVAFPVFLLVMRIVWRDLANQPAQADSAVRRWLTYLALLLASATLIGDVAALVEHVLRGELSAPFAAKVLVVFILAGGVFRFFLESVQPGGEDRQRRLRRNGRVYAAVSGVLIVMTLVLSFVHFGSPAKRRLSSTDERRSEDLEAIARVIRNRWTAARGQDAATLPASLQDLPERATLRLADPVSGAPYRYTPLGGARYQLCARFETDTARLPVRARRSVFRIHPAGDYCFAVDAPVSLP